MHFPATGKFWLYKFVEEIVEILLIAISLGENEEKRKTFWLGKTTKQVLELGRGKNYTALQVEDINNK